MVFEIGGLHNKPVSFPSADGMPERERFISRRMLTAVEVNNAFGVHPINLHRHTVTLNSYGIGDRIEHQGRRSYGNTILLCICLGIYVCHGGLAFVRDGPVPHTAKTGIEFDAG